MILPSNTRVLALCVELWDTLKILGKTEVRNIFIAKCVTFDAGFEKALRNERLVFL